MQVGLFTNSGLDDCWIHLEDLEIIIFDANVENVCDGRFFIEFSVHRKRWTVEK